MVDSCADLQQLKTRPYIIFDFDGTLANTGPAIAAAAKQAMLDLGYTEEEIGDAGRIVGPSFPGAFSEVYGVSAEQDQIIIDQYRKYYDWSLPESNPLFPGVKELLANLKSAGKTLAISSCKAQFKIDNIVDMLEIREFFDVIAAQSDEHGSSKVDILSWTLEALGATPDQCVMVGDRFYDIVGAHELNIPCIGVPYASNNAAELTDAGADALASTVEDIGTLLA